MNINTRTIGDVHILDISGKINLGQGTMVVRNTIKDLLHSGVKKIVLNLAAVSHIDSLAWRADSVLPGTVCHICINGIGQSSLAILGSGFAGKLHSLQQMLATAHVLLPFALAVISCSVALLWLGVRRVEERVRTR
jgi:hypothetical protein